MKIALLAAVLVIALFSSVMSLWWHRHRGETPCAWSVAGAFIRTAQLASLAALMAFGVLDPEQSSMTAIAPFMAIPVLSVPALIGVTLMAERREHPHWPKAF